MGDDKQYLFKVIIIGEAGVGKTSVIRRYVDNVFSHKYRYTIGVDFALKVVEWDKDTTVRLQLWDIAGQERFGIMTRVYYKEATAAVIVFDITSQKTFQAVTKWKADLDSKVQLQNGEPVPALLLANKCDLDARPISDEEIGRFCKENGFLGWYSVSAKSSQNIDRAMSSLVNHILHGGGEDALNLAEERDHGLVLDQKRAGVVGEDSGSSDGPRPCCGGGSKSVHGS